MTKAIELRDKSPEELEAMLADVRKELFQLTNAAKQTKKPEDPGTMRQMKKEIARILTVIKEKQLANK